MSGTKRLNSYTESQIEAAITGAEGLILRAATTLEVHPNTLGSALTVGRFRRLGELARQLRAAHGHGSGHPVVVNIPRVKFASAWRAHGESVHGVAHHFGVTPKVIYRHLEKFKIKGRPQPAFMRRAPRRGAAQGR